MHTRVLTKIAICVALLSVSAYISIPLPFTAAMLTALTIVVNLIAFVLSPKQAFITLAVYILLGVVGVPVFVGGVSGPGKLFGPTGGFIFGYLAAVPLMSLCKGKTNSFKRYMAVDVFIGMPIIYLGGMLSMCLVQDLDIFSTLIVAVFPFIVGDLVKSGIAAYLGVKLNRVFSTEKG
ncbi:biotin transporter BioY [Anaerosinus massiliensis]|uniref:biotin transporter BioY n=1 Tax=Massilibacillus massiliensis TaxID=1806837 RepID=UPI000A54F400|nr:biotin transporter BioY [Massilibacillus massiliensis]